jgi:hypothetical protein
MLSTCVNENLYKITKTGAETELDKYLKKLTSDSYKEFINYQKKMKTDAIKPLNFEILVSKKN